VLDQLMVILYFRVAVLTPTDVKKPVDAALAADKTLKTILFVFALYALWDLGGIRMAAVKDSDGYKYPRIEDEEKTAHASRQDWRAFVITSTFLAIFAALVLVSDHVDVGKRGAGAFFVLATFFLIGYRFAKEIKASWWPSTPRAASSGTVAGPPTPDHAA
jgi:hypothetical protein